MLLSSTLVNGLQSHWQLDDGPGVTAVDAAGTNDLDLQNGAAFDPAAGRLDGALSFDGVDDKAEAGDTLDPFAGDYSVSLWFKRPAGGTVTSDQFLISKGNRYSTREGWSINISDSTQEIRLRVNSSDDSSQRASTEVDLPLDDQWHHLTMVVDRTEGRVIGYLDGSNAGWRSGGGGPSSSSLSNVTDIDTDDPLTLGAVRDGANTYHNFEGVLDDVRVYDRVLTEAEAFSLAHPPDLENGLLAHYRADESSGTTAADELGGNDLSLINGTTFDPTGGRLDGALGFDGVDDRAELSGGGAGGGDVFDPGTGDFTASLWFKRPQGGALQSDQVLISKGNRYSTRAGWSVNFSDATNEIRFRVNSSDDSSERASIEVDVPQDDAWHHLVVTIDHATNKLVGYLDGDSSVWRSGGGGPSSSSLSSITDIDTDDPFTLGAVRDGANTYYEFKGLVDEVRLYDRVLTGVEIAALGDPAATPQTSVQIAGPAEVEAHTSYVLDLSVEDADPDNPIDEWVIDWGDGTAPEVVVGSPTSVTHVYEVPRETNALITAAANAIAGDGTVTTYTAEASIALLVTPSAVVDTDGDGLVDLGEQQAGTDPENVDTDGDQFQDGFEVENYFPEIGLFNPLVADDPNADHDNDRLSNIDEVLVHGTNPSSNLDTDGDSLSDDWEVVHGLDPLVSDGSYDYDVTLGEYVKNYADTDGDGINTLDEYVYGLDPNAFNEDLFTPATQPPLQTFGVSAFSSTSATKALVNLWATIGDWSPSEDELWEMVITSVSTGIQRIVSAPNKTDTIPELVRLVPGEYTVNINFKGPGSASGAYGYDYRGVLQDNPGTPWGGAYNHLSGKGYAITGNDGLLADRVNGSGDNNAADKTAYLRIDPIQLDQLTVSDSRNELRQGSDSADGSSTPVVIPLDKDGNATIQVEGLVDLSGFPAGSEADAATIKYELRDATGTPVLHGDLGAGPAKVPLPTGQVGDYELVAWVDNDGSGSIDNGEQELGVTVSVAQLGSVFVQSENHPSNWVESTLGDTGAILYVELEDDETSVPISFDVSLLEAGIERSLAHYWISGPGVDERNNFNDLVNPLVELPQAGGTYTVFVGFDLDGNGELDVSEASMSVSVGVVGLDTLTVSDSNSGGEVQADSSTEVPTFTAEETPGTNEGSVEIEIEAEKPVVGVGDQLLWQIVGGAVAGSSSGTYNGSFDKTLTPAGASQDREYFVLVGFDDNNDGLLEESEVSRQVNFYVRDDFRLAAPYFSDQVSFQTSQRVDIHGVPLPDASPTGDGEADRVPGMAHVDAFSLLPTFATTDVAVPMPGGELSLEFRRTLSAGADTDSVIPIPNPVFDLAGATRALQLQERINYAWPSDSAMGHAQTTNTASRAILTDDPDPHFGHAGRKVTVYDEVGAAATFARVSGQWVPDIRHSFSNASLRGQLQDAAGGGFIYTKRHGTKLHFETFVNNQVKRGVGDDAPEETYFRLAKIVDRNGNELVHEYNAAGLSGRAQDTLVSRIYDPSAEGLTTKRQITFEYGEVSGAEGPRLTKVTDPLGREHVYRYFGQSDPDGPEWKAGELQTILKPQVAGPDGAAVDARVDFDLETVQAVRIAPSTTGMPLEQRDVYRTRWFLPAEITAVGDAARPETRHTTTFDYARNAAGNVSTVSLPTGIQARELSVLLGDVALIFENRPVLSSVTTDDGTARFELSPDAAALNHFARTTKVTDTRGVETTFAFDADPVEWNNDLGFAIALHQVTRTTADHPSLGGSGLDHTVTYTYSSDIHNNLVEVNDVSGNVVRYEYASGEVGDAYDAPVYGDALVGNHYQVFGQPSRSVLAANDPGLAIATDYRYDTAFNKLVRQIDAEGVVTAHDLDAAGNRVAVHEAVGTTVAATTVYDYDGRGFVTRVTDPEGRVTEHVSNAYGHLDATVVKGRVDQNEDLTALDAASYHSDLDPLAHWIVTRRVTDDPATAGMDEGVLDLTYRQIDPTGDVTGYAYDRWDRLVAVTPPAVADPDNPASVVTSPLITFYDARGNAVRRVDAAGHTTVTFYDRLNRPTVSVLDLDGDAAYGTYLGAAATPGTVVTDIGQFGLDPDDIGTFTRYDAVGLADLTVDARGHATTHHFDELLRRVRTDLPAVTRVDGAVENHSVTYEYGANSGSGAFTFGGFNPTRVVDARGYATDTVYDAAYRAVRVTQRADNGAGRPHTAAPGAGEPSVVTTYNRVHQPTLVSVWNEANDGATRVDQNVYTFYDHRHRPTLRVIDMSGDGVGGGLAAGAFLNDPLGFAGHTDDLATKTGYDASGLVTVAVDPEGRRTVTVYDGAGRVTAVDLPVVDLYDPGLGLTEDQMPGVRTYYNADGLVALTRDPNANWTATYYDARNRVTATVLDLDGDSSFAQPPGSAVADPTALPADPGGAVAGDDVVHRTLYDLNGNAHATIDPRGHRTDLRYDRADRVVTITGPAVPDAENGDALTRPVTETRYDRSGNVTELIDPRGVITRTAYDQYDRAFRVIANAGAAPAAADRLVTETLYDAHGHALALTLHNVVDGVEHPQTTTYTYDAYGRRISETLPGVGDGVDRTTTTTYDRVGNALTTTDPEGQTVAQTYDRTNRVVATELRRADGSVEEARANAYDRVGNLLSSTDLHGTSTYVYDALNRVTSESRTNLASAGGGSGGDGYTVQSGYDANGNRTWVAYPDAGGVAGGTSGGASGAGRALVSRYDARDLLVEVTDGGSTTTYAYDLSGNRTARTLPNGVASVSTFDALNRVVTLAEQDAAGNDLYTLGYTYDLAGNRRSAAEAWAPGTAPGSTASSKTTTYAYDDLYRLTGETSTVTGFPSGNGTTATTWSYDPAGNRLTQTQDGVTTTYAYDDLNQLLTVTDSAGTTTYTYDPNGNRTTKDGPAPGSADRTDYTYDVANRLIQVDVDGTAVFAATYDARTRRLSKIEGTDATTFRYDGGTSFQEFKDGDLSVEFVRGSGMGGGIGSILYRDTFHADGSLKATESYHYNAVGHVVANTYATGALTQTNAYDAFGQVVASSGGSDNNRLANTKERDASIGLDNHGFRYYDPEIGRYITRDPIGYGDGMNVYAHVHNNPINHIDPLGLYAKEEAPVRFFLHRLGLWAPPEKQETPAQATTPRQSRTSQVLETGVSNPQDYIDARASTERLADQIEVIRATGETVYLETGRAVRDEALTAGMGKYQNVAGAAIGAGRRAGGVMDSFGDEAAGAAQDGHQVTRNAAEGRRRQQGAHDELVAEHPNASVQSEQYLRTSDGVRAIDPLTGTGRRIDNVVIQDGQAVRSVETTSLTADKRLQQQHEARVREAGGTFVRDRQTRELVDLSEVPTEIDRRE